MSPPGRTGGEYRRAQPEGTPASAMPAAANVRGSPLPGPQLVVNRVRWAAGMAIPAAREWRGNGRKAH